MLNSAFRWHLIIEWAATLTSVAGEAAKLEELADAATR
jgi:hypothetical protein